MDTSKERISELEDRSSQIIQTIMQREKKVKKKTKYPKKCEIIYSWLTQVIWVSENKAEKKKHGEEESFENIMTKNFPKIMKDYKLHIQESQTWINMNTPLQDRSWSNFRKPTTEQKYWWLKMQRIQRNNN